MNLVSNLVHWINKHPFVVKAEVTISDPKNEKKPRLGISL